MAFTILATGASEQTWLKSDALGYYSADFSALGGIPAVGTLMGEVVFTPKNSGNVTNLEKIVP